jgi:hypothetical protein
MKKKEYLNRRFLKADTIDSKTNNFKYMCDYLSWRRKRKETNKIIQE